MRYSASPAGGQVGAIHAQKARTEGRRARLDAALEAAMASLLSDQQPDGHWVYELEADATIPAEYVLMVHYLGEAPDTALEAKIARYLRRTQEAHGGWPLYHGGPCDPSASVKACFALKMIGDSPDAPHMARARRAILAHGGAERSNVFTRILLALYRVTPWEAVPVLPVEIALLPRWFPFHLSKVSCWTRTLLVPLLVLGTLRPRARNARAPRAPHQARTWFVLFRTLEAWLRLLAPRIPARLRRRAIESARAREWVEGMQCRGGGWGAFDADNTQHYLNNIPFADHGALLDPPTADVSARCLSMMARLQPGACARKRSPAARALAWLLRNQEKDGSWYGRWGLNYIYGTWSALSALGAAGLGADAAPVARGAAWLAAVQNPDGGWGEDGDSYSLDYHGYEPATSTASQAAWALLGLMAAGSVDTPAVERGIDWLLDRQRASDGLWDEPQHTATGFERVFYLRYHGYARYFPLWALARYRNLRARGSRRVAFGM
jgi:squalene cyclase